MKNGGFSMTSQSRRRVFQVAFYPPVAFPARNITNGGNKTKRNVKKLCMCSQCHTVRGKRSFSHILMCVWAENCTFPVNTSLSGYKHTPVHHHHHHQQQQRGINIPLRAPMGETCCRGPDHAVQPAFRPSSPAHRVHYESHKWLW